jgi:competence protein ComEC
MLLSHADADHAGGAPAVMRGLPVARVLSGEAAALPAVLGAHPCISDERWEWDGVRFSLWQWAQAGDSNQDSCVLMVEARGERLFLTGDMDARSERAWLQSEQATRADWLQAPHHGSRSSSSQPFLEAVAPKGVLISRGRHNAFGHPHPQVMARYRVYDNVEQGALRLQLGRFSGPEGLRAQRRFWRDVIVPKA